MPAPSWLLLLLVWGLSQSVRTQTEEPRFEHPTDEFASPQVTFGIDPNNSKNARINLEENASDVVLAMIIYSGSEQPVSISSSELLEEKYEKDKAGTWYVRVTKSVDFDPPNSVETILVPVKIGDWTGVLNINIKNINDNAPTVSPKSDASCTFQENWSGETNCTLTVKDIDKRVAAITYKTNEEEIFEVRPNPTSINDDTTIDITLWVKKKLDYESKPIYSVIITAIDSDQGVTFEGSFDYLVQLIDEPDELPLWVDIFAAKSVSEKTPESFQLTAIDGDRAINDKIGYKFETDPIDGFEIDDSGLLKIPYINRDEEKIDVYKLTVIAYEKNDPGSFIKAEIAILVIDLNDNIPTITPDNMNLNLPEETALTFDKGIEVKDPDLASNGTFTVNIEKSDLSDAFMIIPNSGYQDGVFTISVVNASALDYDLEDKPFPEFPIITLTIIAAERDDPSRSSSIQVTITLMDENDEIPVFVQEEYNITIPENEVSGTTIVTVTAKDRDVNDNIRYFMNQRTMTVDQDNGIVTLTDDNAFDYERQSVMTVQVTARDDKDHTAFADIIINIIDLNDEPPTLYMPNRPAIDEHSTEVIGEIRASDPDKEATLEFSIKWDSSSATKQGAPVKDTSKYEKCLDIQFKERRGTDWVADLIVSDPELLDWEVFDTFYVMIVVKDTSTTSGYEHNEARNATLSVSILDINDCAPKFDDSKQTNLTVAENSKAEQLIGSVIATDDDGVGNNEITYSLIDLVVPSGMVVINPNTGELSVGEENIDYEEIQVLKYNVSAYDKKHTTYTEITIYVRDINDEKPYELPFNKTPSIKEHSSDSEFITQVKADDDDLTAPFNTLSYLLNNFDEYFYLNRSSGELFVNPDSTKVLDREEKDVFDIRITIRDNYEDGLIADSLSTETTVTLTLEDINDNRPILRDVGECMGVTRYETLTENEIVYTGILADDKDIGRNGEVVYSIESIDCVKCYDSDEGIEHDYFRIETKDYKTANIYANRDMTDLWGDYNVQIKAQDRGEEPLDDSKNYTICIKDLNNNLPVIVKPKENQSIYIKYSQTVDSRLEGRNSGSIEDFCATDKDSYDENNGKVEFQVVGDDTALKYFTMNNLDDNKGYLKLKIELDENIPDDGTFKLTISSKDLGTPDIGTSSINFNIHVINLIDFPPNFSQKEWEATFTENTTGLEESVTIPLATDKNNINLEEGEPEDPIYYHIIEKENVFFNLNKNTGVLSLLKPLDYEEQTIHTFTVLASNIDKNNAISDENSILTVTIKVNDINDMPPRFVNSTFMGGFSTDEKSGKKVIQLEANDPDLGDKMEYSIVEGTMDASDSSISGIKDDAFKLNDSTGGIDLNFQPASSQKGHFTFQVKVRDSFDGPDEGHMDLATVNVFIISDENRVLFRFNNPLKDVISEENEIKTVLSTVFSYSCGVDSISAASDDNSVLLVNVTDVLTHFVNEKTGQPVDKVEITNKLSDRVIFAALTSAFMDRRLYLDSYDAGDPGAEDMEGYMQIILIAVSAVLATMVVVLFVAFFYRTRALNQRLEALSTTKFGSQESGLNRVGIAVPNTNQHAIEGSNPVWNEDEPEYDNMSQGSGDSDLIGIEDNPEFSPNGNNFSVNTNHFDTVRGAENGGFTMDSEPGFHPRASINPLVGSGADSTIRRISVNPLVASAGTGDPIEPSNNNFSFQDADPSEPHISSSNSNFIFRKPDAMPITEL